MITILHPIKFNKLYTTEVRPFLHLATEVLGVYIKFQDLFTIFNTHKAEGLKRPLSYFMKIETGTVSIHEHMYRLTVQKFTSQRGYTYNPVRYGVFEALHKRGLTSMNFNDFYRDFHYALTTEEHMYYLPAFVLVEHDPILVFNLGLRGSELANYIITTVESANNADNELINSLLFYKLFRNGGIECG